MNDLQKFNDAFIASFGVEEAQLGNLCQCNTNKWDSVGHMTLITYLEDNLDIEIEPEDIMCFTSYQAAMKILNTKYNIEF